MVMTRIRPFLFQLVFMWLAIPLTAPAVAKSVDGPTYEPDGLVTLERVNELMGVDAERIGEFSPAMPVNHLKYPLTGWQEDRQALAWNVTVTNRDAFDFNLIAQQMSGSALKVTLEIDGIAHSALLQADPQGFETRSLVTKGVALDAGPHRIVLRLSDWQARNAFAVDIRSVEVVASGLASKLISDAATTRADVRWMARERFGLMVHWTKRTTPRSGAAKSYNDAVVGFNVERFADEVRATGATFVVLTTAHADQYFPAPLKSLDRILPGRTASRDLVADLIKALARRHMKLFLYYHIGAIDDVAWGRATGLWNTDSRRLFANWRSIISEIGERYGTGLAGWWFDDGLYNYFYRSPDWASLERAAKAGNPVRAVCFNSWRGTSATEFQDYHCGEEIVPGGANEDMNRDGSMNGLLEEAGDGRIKRGSFAGLQAAGTFSLEGDWVHTKRDTPAAKPKFTAVQLADTLQRMRRFKSTPIINVVIYQDGTIADASLQTVRDANALLGTQLR